MVTFTTIEKGSGPLHAIVRLEGEYRYDRTDNRPAPFVTRLHVWAGKPWIKVLHTFTYTPDAGKSVAVLGNTASAYGQVWHALTSKETMSGEQYVRTACELAGKPYTIQVAPRWMLGLMGLFVPVLRENMEMMYQFEHHYRFDSSKLEQAFELQATGYRAGIAATLAH